MPRGGPRPGSGRKKGSLTKRTRAIAEAVIATGATPLEFLLTTMANKELELAVRLDAAKSAAPYVHPKLSSVEHKGDAEHPLVTQIISGVPRQTDTTDVPQVNGHAQH